MARTVITPQVLNQQTGAEVTFVAIDQANGMQVQNTGREVVLVKTPSGGGTTIKFPSAVCSHNRTGDVGPTNIGANLIQEYGPFVDPTIWGDGVANLYVNFTATTGSVTIAVV